MLTDKDIKKWYDNLRNLSELYQTAQAILRTTKTRVKDRHYEQPVCIKIAAPG